MSGRGAAALLALAVATCAGSAPAGSSSASLDARVAVNPLAVELALSAGEVTVGRAVRATATVRNLGVSPLQHVVVEIRVDPAGVIVKGSGPKAVGALNGGERARVSWSLCGAVPGAYVVLARATGDGPAGPFSAEGPAALLRVTGDPRKTC